MTDSVDLNGDTRAIAGWIWRNLVPKSGQAGTVQGELLRAVEKLSWEAQNNGNANWDNRFEMFIEFLGATLSAEPRLSQTTLATVRQDLATLANYDEPYIEDDLYDRLTEVAVNYCRLNPVLIPRTTDPQQYR
jgi:hypothetical protein